MVFKFMLAHRSVQMVLGRNEEDESIELATFYVPFGYSLLISPNTVHSDSLSTGYIALSLDDESSADSVFFRTN